MKKLPVFIILIILASCTYVNEDNYSEENVALLKKGREAFSESNFEDAKAYFELAYENGVNAESLDALGCIATVQGALEDARELFIRAIEANSEFALAYGHLAYIYELIGDNKKAKENYLKSMELNPNDIRIRNNFASFLYDFYKEQDQKQAKLLAKLELKKAWILSKDDGKINRNLLELEKEIYGK